MRLKELKAITLLLILTAVLSSCSEKRDVPTPKPVEQPVPSAPVLPPEKRVKDNVYLEDLNVGGMTEAEVTKKVQEMASKINKDAVNAKVDSAKWVVTVKEKAGKKVNIEAAVKALIEAGEGEKIKLNVEQVLPELTAEKAKSNITEIGSFTTKILDQDENRLNNIKIASQKMDYKKLGPGEVFSFNGIVGVRNEAKGYEEAPIIIQTEEGPKKKDGVGGGVCQLSTTIYNAAEKAGMEITERHMHSKNIGYVPEGQDATVSYGSVDLKFKNTRNHPIMLRVSMTQNTLTVRILENRNL